MGLQVKYAPEIPEVFKCRVPLEDTGQVYLMNGFLRDSYSDESGIDIVPGETSGFKINVADGTAQNGSVQLISIRDSANTAPVSMENEINVGKDSTSSFLICTHTLSLNEFVTESFIKIEADSYSTSHIVLMQNEHNLSTHKINFIINLQKGAFVRVNIVTLHGALLENNIEASMMGEGAVCELNGIYLADGTQQINTKVIMNHLVPHCNSSQLFKGILDNEAKASFSGRIVVAKDAQKTEAYQSNHNLLLSRKAKVYAQPQLEIYADDVKCSHGATSGRLDQNALFYMRSRGIGSAEAKLLQQIAFVYDVLEKIENQELRGRLQDMVESRLRGEFSHCANCSMNCC